MESFGGWLCEQTNMQDYREAEKVVIRRFSDFVWLHLRLTECYKGVIIAALPGKSAVGKTSTILGPHFGCKGYVNFVTNILTYVLGQMSHLLLWDAEKFRFSAEFVEVRRRALDVFLNRIAAHPQLRMSEDLKNFLQADEEIWVGSLKPHILILL